MNSWRFLNTFKNTATKVSNDKSLPSNFQQILAKIPQTIDFNEYFKIGERKAHLIKESLQNIYSNTFKQENNKNKKAWKKSSTSYESQVRMYQI